MIAMRQRRTWVSTAVLIFGALLALLVRLPFLDMLSHDIIGSLGHWYDYIALNGGLYALGDRFADYTPAYLYLLTGMVYLREDILPELSRVAAIKLPSIAADLVMAIAVYRLVRVFAHDKLTPALAFVIALLLPTVVINSAVWGQADSMYTACLVWSIYLLCMKRPAAAMIITGVGLALKPQTIFIAPLLLYLLLRHRLYIWHLLIVPAIYAASMLPVILLGRPPLEELGTIVAQAGEYHQLSLGAPNLYLFAPPDLYHFGVVVGVIISVIAGLVIAVGFTLRAREPDPDDILAGALVCVMVMPFVLPMMHERYFFPADVLSLVVAFRWRKFMWLPVACQIISLSAYASVLQQLSWWNQILPGVKIFAWLNAVILCIVVVNLIVQRKTSLPGGQRNAALTLAGGGSAITLTAVVALALSPYFRQAPDWVSAVDLFHSATPAAITYGDAIELVGYYLPQTRAYRTGIMPIDLYFKPLRSLTENYRLQVEAFATDGRSLELVYDRPVTEAPLSTWKPGQVYMQSLFLTIWSTVDVPTLATYRVNWVDPQTGKFLPARCGGKTCDTKIGTIPIGLDLPTVEPWQHAPAQASFGPAHELSLLGAVFKPDVRPGQTIVVTTTWRMQASSVSDLTLFVHVLSRTGQMVAQSDAPARGGLYPTSVWHLGEVVFDTNRLTLPADLPAGDYQVVLGAYPPTTLQRIPVSTAQGARLQDDVAPLGVLHVR